MNRIALMDAIRRVEEAPLADLVSIDLDAVQAQMDHLLNKQEDSASFYRRWETQPWAVSELDFTRDKEDWAALHPGFREGIKRTMSGFFVGEQAVTDTLSPLLHAAPREDERVFLATQVADEARHSVFFQRYFNEVLGVGGGLTEALNQVRPNMGEGYRKIFDRELVDATELVRREPKNLIAWVEGVVTYHLVIEGYLALTSQRNTLRLLKNIGVLPGFVGGFTAVTRDESRHIGFGVFVLRRRIHENPEMARVITRKVLALLPPAVETLTNPTQRLAVENPNELPPAMRLDPMEARAFAIDSLTKRLRACDLSEAAVNDVEQQMNALYEDAWRRYEEQFGVKHPVRYFQEGLVTA